MKVGDEALLRPFIAATGKVIETLCKISPVRGKSALNASTGIWGELTAILEIESEIFNGNLLLSFDRESILTIADRVLCGRLPEIDESVEELVINLISMIGEVGGEEFKKIGCNLTIKNKSLVKGEGGPVLQRGEYDRVQIPFYTTPGLFVLESDIHEK